MTLSKDNQDRFEMLQGDVQDDEIRVREAKLEIDNAKKWLADSEGALGRSKEALFAFKKEHNL